MDYGRMVRWSQVEGYPVASGFRLLAIKLLALWLRLLAQARNTHTQQIGQPLNGPRCTCTTCTTCTTLLMWPFVATWQESQVAVSRGPLFLRLVTSLQACCCLPVLGGGWLYISSSPRPVGPQGRRKWMPGNGNYYR